jgi:hypothetical protein
VTILGCLMDILIIVMSGGVETPGAETGAVSIRE